MSQLNHDLEQLGLAVDCAAESQLNHMSFW